MAAPYSIPQVKLFKVSDYPSTAALEEAINTWVKDNANPMNGMFIQPGDEIITIHCLGISNNH
jgi:hypothetical protein